MTDAVTNKLRSNALPLALLAACAIRLWLMVLSTGFWTDEAATALVVERPSDPSFGVVPYFTQSIYYALPRAVHALAGFSEWGYRLPSVIAMGLAFWFVARIAARLIDPEAAWFAVFACFALTELNYYAVDARPYSPGICCAAGALWFLIRWLDRTSWRDAALCFLFATLLWRVHSVYWPFYPVLAAYALARRVRGTTKVTWAQLGLLAGGLMLSLLPVAIAALRLARNARLHVVVALPQFIELRRLLRQHWNFVAVTGGAAWLMSKLARLRPDRKLSAAAILVPLAWVLSMPLTIYIYSHVSRVSLFVPRYLSLSLPGAALCATAAAAYFLPRRLWRPMTVLMGLGALVYAGDWSRLWPEHDDADWRAPAQYINASVTGDIPVICPSPFVEADPPVWSPNYALPGFLYSELYAYPIRGKAYPFPFSQDADAKAYAIGLLRTTLVPRGEFVLYASRAVGEPWRKWFRSQPELDGWQSDRELFGALEVTIFRR